MSEILFVTWDGGGNVPPLLGLARELHERGHVVRVVGHAAQADRFAPLRFSAHHPRREFTATGPVNVPALLSVFADRRYGAEVLRLLDTRPADVVVVDCLLFGVMDALRQAERPYVVLEHTLDSYLRVAARGPMGLALRAMRLPALRLLDAATERLAATLPELDAGHGPCTHIGPVVTGTSAAPTEPRVLLSLSTVAFRGLPVRWQRALDAVGELGVPVIATLGPAIDPSRLRVPANVEVHRWLAHDEVLTRVSLVVGHGGHATTMAALAHDVPVLVLPVDSKSDQPLIGRRITDADAGLSLPPQASTRQIRAAVKEMLENSTYRCAAARLGARIRALDGRTRGADQLESLASTGGVGP
jgi:UDP:flavonoid glycosyltransferase YjiC (YdhE family)